MSARVRSAIVALAAVATLATSTGSALAATGGTAADRLLGTTEYLARGQLRSGDLSPPALTLNEGPSTQMWGALGLAAGGINAAKQREVPGAGTLYASLDGRPLASTGEIALMLLIEPTVHDVTGTEPDRVEGLVRGVLDAQNTTGPDAGGFGRQGPGGANPSATALAALALEGVRDDPDVRVTIGDAIVNAVTWLGAHGTTGTWGDAFSGPSNTEASALAVEAIQASGLSSQPLRNAVNAFGAWLAVTQNPDGGFGTGAPGAPSDIMATASAARALAATGTPPSRFRYQGGGPTPIDFLGAAQDPVDGHVGGATYDPVRLTGYAALAFAGVSLPLGHVTGSYGVGSLPPQTVPQNLPSGPTLPVEVPATKPSSAPLATTTAPTTIAPVIAPPAAATKSKPSGVRRVKNTKKSPADEGDGTGDAGSGNGSGGGGGTVATPGAADRAGGGGGDSPGPVSAAAPSVAGSGIPLPGSRRGGKRVKTGRTAPREVSGTLIGRDSATPGAAGSRVATPGAAGASAGHAPTAWWAIALALTILAGIAAGVRLDRRSPELAL